MIKIGKLKDLKCCFNHAIFNIVISDEGTDLSDCQTTQIDSVANGDDLDQGQTGQSESVEEDFTETEEEILQRLQQLDHERYGSDFR